MITLKNITDKEHEELLKSMLIKYYQEEIGPDWAEKIPIRKLRDRLSAANGKASSDLYDIFEQNLLNTVVFGLYSEEDKCIGIALLDIFRDQKRDGVIDTYGELYRLYILPEYRKLFISSYKNGENIQSFKTQLEGYYKSHDINEVMMMVPRNISYLLELNRELGFNQLKDQKEYADPIKTQINF